MAALKTVGRIAGVCVSAKSINLPDGRGASPARSARGSEGGVGTVGTADSALTYELGVGRLDVGEAAGVPVLAARSIVDLGTPECGALPGEARPARLVLGAEVVDRRGQALWWTTGRPRSRARGGPFVAGQRLARPVGRLE
ncbi:hypothetical protein [Actinomadura sp. BRA 177]|uniref:hypothetical protein n=1 Tax=Actinomadura sp. BRA 177 TaxID=2745202 RepID=UPI00159548E6|nr:hypothetical protein [Actinomadura sp. BRA 177]NVI86937.1 hypothetical protein [Actinomadura sp. BRA 177]